MRHEQTLLIVEASGTYECAELFILTVPTRWPKREGFNYAGEVEFTLYDCRVTFLVHQECELEIHRNQLIELAALEFGFQS